MNSKVLESGVITAGTTIAVLQPATRGQLFYLYFEILSEGAAILTCHHVIILSAAFLGFRTEPHGASVDTKACFFFWCVCLKSTFCSSPAAQSSAQPAHTALCLVKRQNLPRRADLKSFQQFHLFIQTAHAVKNIHLHPIGGFVCLFVCGVFWQQTFD